MPSYRHRTLLSAAVTLTLTLATPALAQTRHFDIAAQPAAKAIPAFAQQAGIQLLALGDAVRGVRFRAVRGDYAVADALRHLLQDTGLVARRREAGGTVYIIERGGDLAAIPPSIAALDDIVVTGSNIRGAVETAPVTVVTARDIQRSGFTTPDQLIRSLTQAGTSSGATGFGGVNSFLNGAATEDGGTVTLANGAPPNSFSAGSGINLRGIGEGGTLILLNGRRLAAAGSSAGQSIDISTIPLNAIDRIEILSNSASAIYGADAIGGVVNIILKGDYRGFDMTARYGLSATSADDASITASGGFGWTGGRLMLSGSYRRDDPVLIARLDAPIGDQRSRGGADFRSDRCAAGEPGDLPVIILPANRARGLSRACLYGPAGPGTGLTAADFIPAAQAGSVRYTDYRSVELTPASNNLAFNGTLSQDVIGSWSIDVSGLWSQRDSTARTLPVSGSVLIPETNPFNPFGRAARTFYDFRGEIAEGWFPQTIQHSRYTSFGGSIALEGKLPLQGWRGHVDLNYGKNITRSDATGLDTAAVEAAVKDTNRATALNLFGDGSGQNPATLRRLVRTGSYPRWIGEERQAMARADGTVLHLPAGDVRAAFGIEYRRPGITRTIMAGQRLAADGLYSRKQYAAYGELQIPLIGADWSIPGIRSLTLTLAGREDWYASIGKVEATQAFTERAGLAWEVVRGLTLRGQYSTAFRVPYNSQLFTPQVEEQGRVGDPKFGGVTVRPMVLGGGNPDLQNQTSTSWSSGGQLALLDRRLTLSVDYYRIDYSNLVFQPRLDEFILIEDLYPQYFRRAAPVAGQTAGALERVVNVPINAASFRTSGLDVQLGFRVPDTALGSFNLSVQATEVLTRKRRLLPLTAETNLRRNALFGVPFSLRGTMDWSKGIVGGFVAVNHKSGTTNPVSGAKVLEVGGLTTVDTQLRVRMDAASGMKGLTLSIGATNLLDTPSPFLDSDYGIDFFKWDPRGRVVYLTIGKSF